MYKQLYRAAKAKSKLKLRVSLKPRESPVVPKPVSIEELLEVNSNVQLDTKPLVPLAPEPPSGPAPPMMSKTYDATTLSAAARIAESDLFRRTLGAQAGPSAIYDSFPSHSQPWPKHESPLEVPGFAICCNSCEKTTPHVHYHCSTCDDGDFDLCEDCVAKGISCYGSDHWLIKRTKINGQIVNSTTEKIAPKPKPAQLEPKKEEPLSPTPSFDAKSALASLQENLAKLEIQTAARVRSISMRTCNQCIQGKFSSPNVDSPLTGDVELPDSEFLHCETCEDYDLCRECFSKDGHGHHPLHAFSPAVAGTVFGATVQSKLAPGRNKVHHAICDNCDKVRAERDQKNIPKTNIPQFITGVRHKCLDCPDWDYCAECVPNAITTHPGHRFVPVYDPLKANYHRDSPAAQHVHVGICCDGPLCSTGKSYPSYIRGVRYKCAVCHDLDFCAGCEANPSNTHNKTHPLIKFNSPVRHVSVTTHGEHANGQQMPTMGDHPQRAPEPAQSLPQVPSKLSMNAPRTVFDTKPQPASPKASPKDEPAKQKSEGEREENFQDMRATFLRDSMQDGTIVNPDQVFEQTWVLRNDGRGTWPIGSAVRFVGGDYMGRMSSRSPVASKALATANVTNATTKPVGPGEECSFTVELRAPPRPGKCISFWRLATPSGHMFGHRLWCDVKVRVISPPSASVTPAPVKAKKEPEQKLEPERVSDKGCGAGDVPKVNSSQMIFPKLEKESPEASIHQESTNSPTQTEEKLTIDDDFEDCSKETEWDGSDDDFLTDEEYDILDASDEEFLEEQAKKASS